MDRRKVFYWNCADNRDHTHKRIEWAIENGYLVCINITIKDKLFNKVMKNDLILAYEPKVHKKNKKQYDGYCISCKEEKHDGLQAFTYAFEIIDSPIKLTTLEEERKIGFNIICGSWIKDNLPNTLTIDDQKKDYENYCKDYYSKNNKKYVFPVKLLGKLQNIISTSKSNVKLSKYYYERPMVKGFNEIFHCGCNNLVGCNNVTCIYNYLNKDEHIKFLF